jgi:hypothetical protein
MRDILFVLSFCVLWLLGSCVLLGLFNPRLDPLALVLTYLGVSRAAAFWIIMGVFVSAIACFFWTA